MLQNSRLKKIIVAIPLLAVVKPFLFSLSNLISEISTKALNPQLPLLHSSSLFPVALNILEQKQSWCFWSLQGVVVSRSLPATWDLSRLPSHPQEHAPWGAAILRHFAIVGLWQGKDAVTQGPCLAKCTLSPSAQLKIKQRTSKNQKSKPRSMWRLIWLIFCVYTTSERQCEEIRSLVLAGVKATFSRSCQRHNNCVWLSRNSRDAVTSTRFSHTGRRHSRMLCAKDAGASIQIQHVRLKFPDYPGLNPLYSAGPELVRSAH